MTTRLLGPLLLLALVALVGCGGKNRTYTASGTVTFDGANVPDGDIIFLDQDKTIGPDAGKIKDGKFSVPVKAGKKKVEIRASKMRKLPAGQKGAMGETEVMDDYIPQKYNSKSELNAEIKAGGANQFDYKLVSK